MVMATDILDVGTEQDSPEMMNAGLLHEQLVAHMRAVSEEEEPRSSVWGEHSYARPLGPLPGAQVRVLLEARPAGPGPTCLDVVTPPPPAPRLPADHCDINDDLLQQEEELDDEWEERLSALAPTAAHQRLASDVVSVLRDLRLERAAGAGRTGRWTLREGARHAARRLRRALAPQWGSAASWVLNALPPHLPPELRALFHEALRELRRAAPRLADRLPLLPAAEEDPLNAVGPPQPPTAPGPWLAWAPSGCAALDERFTRRIGALLHVRVLSSAAQPPAPPAPPAAPDRWCAALAQDARAALADVLHDAGERPVVLCGLGAGAALATWLAAGAAAGAGCGAGGVRALLLLAPPLITAEGVRDCPEDILEEVDVPLLAVVGGGAAQCWRGAAAEVAARDAPDSSSGSSDTVSVVPRASRRVLLLSAADDALRLPRRLRARLQLPQQALDAAVAEECTRWASDVTDPAHAAALLAACTPRSGRTSPASSEPRAEPLHRQLGVGGVVGGGGAAGAGDGGGEGRPSPGNTRAIEIVEGRVVSRGSGGSPLTLLPPQRVEGRGGSRGSGLALRRAEGRGETSLAAADIMQLPIVFADDDPVLETSRAAAPTARGASPARDVGGALTVTSGNPRRVPAGGAIKYTRVIVAKRAPAGRVPVVRAAPREPALRAVPRRGPGRPPSRPALVRRRQAD